MQITLEPENRIMEINRVSSAMGLLNRLGLKPFQALVIRDNRLLTPDSRLNPEDNLIVRKVVSRG
ncbi:MAG: hypothetical protein ACOCPN_04680 [Desulfonatronovibrionaceae bacterium]